MKERIQILLHSLLDSALARGTNQGVFTFREALEILDGAASDQQILSLLSQANKAITSIEAHGFLTADEFSWAKELREIEQASSPS